MTPEQFNKLAARHKWERYKRMTGAWACRSCKSIVGMPYRAPPFHGAEVRCANCDHLLTRRTGGGMQDRFEWVLT